MAAIDKREGGFAVEKRDVGNLRSSAHARLLFVTGEADNAQSTQLREGVARNAGEYLGGRRHRFAPGGDEEEVNASQGVREVGGANECREPCVPEPGPDLLTLGRQRHRYVPACGGLLDYSG